jgi:hypothetical protein
LNKNYDITFSEEKLGLLILDIISSSITKLGKLNLVGLTKYGYFSFSKLLDWSVGGM